MLASLRKTFLVVVMSIALVAGLLVGFARTSPTSMLHQQVSGTHAVAISCGPPPAPC